MKFIFFLIFLIIASEVFSQGIVERRVNKEDSELSYFLYPLIYQVPGLGSGEGAGGTIVGVLQ